MANYNNKDEVVKIDSDFTGLVKPEEKPFEAPHFHGNLTFQLSNGDSFKASPLEAGKGYVLEFYNKNGNEDGKTEVEADVFKSKDAPIKYTGKEHEAIKMLRDNLLP